MLNKKHITTIAALSLSAVLLTGCQAITEPVNVISPNAAPEAPLQPTETSLGSGDQSAGSSAVSSIQTAVSSDFDERETSTPRVTINVNCTLPTDVPEQVDVLKTKPFWFEPGLPEELLLTGENYEWEETRQNRYYPEIETPIYVHPEDKLLMLGYNGNSGGDFYFNRYDDHLYGTVGNHCDYAAIEPVSWTDSALDGFTPEEAISKARDMLGQLGITNLGEPNVVAVKADKANEWLGQTEWENKDGSKVEWKEWTKDDEVYYLTFPIVFNNIPVATSGSCSGGMTRNDFELDGTYVQVTVGRDEIKYINTYDIPDAEVETAKTADISISAQQALDILTEHHTAEDFPIAINVNDVSLVYAVSKNDKYFDTCEAFLVPMWKFEMTYESTLGGDVCLVEFIDAQTGRGQFEH